MEKFMQAMEKTFTGLFEKLQATMDKKFEGAEVKLASLEDQIASIKSAKKEVAGRTSVSKDVLGALGNSAKAAGGASVAEGAMFLKDIISGGTTDHGAELLDTELHEGILQLVSTRSALLRDVSKFFTKERTYRMVFSLNGGNFQRIAEGGEIPVNDKDFKSKEVTCTKAAEIIGLSREILEDSAPEDIGAFILTQISDDYRTFMTAEIVAAVEGGNFPAVVGASGADATVDDMIDMTLLPHESCLDNSAFYAVRNEWANIRKLKDTTGRYLVEIANPNIVQTDGVRSGNEPVGYVDSYPLYLDRLTYADGSPSIYFGNLAKAIAIVITKGFEIEQNDSQKFSSEIRLIKATERNVVTTMFDGGTVAGGQAALSVFNRTA